MSREIVGETPVVEYPVAKVPALNKVSEKQKAENSRKFLRAVGKTIVIIFGIGFAVGAAVGFIIGYAVGG